MRSKIFFLLARRMLALRDFLPILEKSSPLRLQSCISRQHWHKNTVWRIRDVYPGSWFLPNTDPGSRIQKQQQKRGVKKKLAVITYVATNFTKLQIILVSSAEEKKIWANFQRIIELFTQQIVTKLSKIWILGSWIQGSKRHRIPDPGSGSATLYKYKICKENAVLRGKN